MVFLPVIPASYQRARFNLSLILNWLPTPHASSDWPGVPSSARCIFSTFRRLVVKLEERLDLIHDFVGKDGIGEKHIALLLVYATIPVVTHKLVAEVAVKGKVTENVIGHVGDAVIPGMPGQVIGADRQIEPVLQNVSPVLGRLPPAHETGLAIDHSGFARVVFQLKAPETEHAFPEETAIIQPVNFKNVHKLVNVSEQAPCSAIAIPRFSFVSECVVGEQKINAILRNFIPTGNWYSWGPITL